MYRRQILYRVKIVVTNLFSLLLKHLTLNDHTYVEFVIETFVH